MSVSSLLKSAQSRRQKIQEQNDAIVAYEYQLSAKTYEDFVEYSNYLRENQRGTTDPSKKLSYEKAINSAQTSYISNEVQRETINVMEGNGNLETKQQKLVDLYYQAADSGNYDLAQSLRSQIDSLSIQIQNEAMARASAGQALAGQLAKMSANSVQDAIKTIKDDVASLNEEFRTSGGTDAFKATLKRTIDELRAAGAPIAENGGYFDVLATMADYGTMVYDNALAQETDPDNIKKFTEDRNTFTQTEAFKIPGVGKDISVSIQDMKDQADAARVGEALFIPYNSGDGISFKKNDKTGFVFGRDADGTFRQIPLYGNAEEANYMSNVVDPDSKSGDKKLNYKDVLAKNGIKVTSNEGYLVIDNSDGKLKGLPMEQIQAYVGTDGRLQIKANNELYNFNFDSTGTFKDLERYQPSSIIQFNGGAMDARGYLKGDARFNTPYYAGKDLSGYGDRGSLVGVVDRPMASRYIHNVANFGTPGGVGSLNLSVPQQITQPVANPQLTLAPIQTAAPIVQAPAPQQTLNPFNLPNVPRLAVSAPAPTPQIAVAPVKTGSISVKPVKSGGGLRVR